MIDWKESLFASAGLFRGFGVIALFAHAYHLITYMVAPSVSLIYFLGFQVVELLLRLPEMIHMHKASAIFQCVLFLILYIILTIVYTVLYFRLNKQKK